MLSSQRPAGRRSSPEPLVLSLVVPAHNEQENLEPTLGEILDLLDAERIPHEAVIVNDNSSDGTQEVAERLAAERPGIRIVRRRKLPGFGRAIRAGLAAASGDVIIILMADRSDEPRDVVRYYRKIEEGYDCVFGSRFRKGSRVERYPPVKLVANRLVNKFIQLLFWTRFNDLTNAFKAFRAEVIRDCGPFFSSHFNITIELSLSALIRQYRIAEIPIHWYGRTWGASNLRITQMGRRYLSVLLRMFFERILISDDILDERSMETQSPGRRQDALEQRIAHLEQALRALKTPAPATPEAAAAPEPRARAAEPDLSGDAADHGAAAEHPLATAVIDDIYAERFSEETPERLRWRRDLWRVLVDGYFSRWIPEDGTVLDFGCGLGEFINAVRARRRIGVDLREGSKQHLDPQVEFVISRGVRMPDVADGRVDVAFCSNLLEHLPDRETVSQLFGEFRRVLKPGGRLLILGPNLRYTGAAYWDFFDHILPFTEASLAEALTVSGFRVETMHPRFLPYTTVGSSLTPLFLVRWYLRIPLAWRFMGAQFFAVATPSRD